MIVRIRTTMDGNKPKRELTVDGVKIADLTRADIIELILQLVSSLRWDK